jgi:hypothetical protein
LRLLWQQRIKLTVGGRGVSKAGGAGGALQRKIENCSDALIVLSAIGFLQAGAAVARALFFRCGRTTSMHRL